MSSYIPKFILSTRFVVVLILMPLLSGCGMAVVGATAAGGSLVFFQERSIGSTIDDMNINIRINNAFLQNDRDLFQRINLTTIEGHVFMTGVVFSEKDKSTATRLAWTVDNIESVTNELQVYPKNKLYDFIHDTWVTTQLKSKFLFDKRIKSINYTCHTINGVVYLMGIALNQEELDAALSIARSIKYVKRVISLVRINN